MTGSNQNNLILFGYQSCGKSYFGKLLSRELHCPFIETDVIIEQFYREKYLEPLSCRQIANKLGEGGFRLLEMQAVDSIREVSNSVISVGGGTLINQENYSKVKKRGKLIFLDVEKQIIKQRIFKDGVPSYLNQHDPENSFEQMYDQRLPIYAKLAMFTVTLQDKSVRQVLDELTSIYTERDSK